MFNFFSHGMHVSGWHCTFILVGIRYGTRTSSGFYIHLIVLILLEVSSRLLAECLPFFQPLVLSQIGTQVQLST